MVFPLDFLIKIFHNPIIVEKTATASYPRDSKYEKRIIVVVAIRHIDLPFMSAEETHERIILPIL